MRNLRKYIGLLLTFMAVSMVSCQDDFDAPGLQIPEATMTPNTTILELKTKYWSDETNYIDTIGLNENGDRIIIAGRVVSSDMTGNIYKNLVIQDGSAALTLSINQSGLYNKYRVGQEIVLDVTGMYIGKYSGLQQLGFPDYEEGYGWQATFMPYEFFQMHSELNGLPEPSKVDTIVTTIGSLPTNPEGLRKWQSQLVRLNNVHFEGGGTLSYTDAHKENANRTLIDAEGNSITVRNSGYATFWSQKLPEGNGDVVGILSYFGSSGWQLLLRSTSDCMNFGSPTLSPGAESNPYTVDQVVEIVNNGQTANGWVTGYLVGAVGPEVTTISSNEDIEWDSPTTLANTIVIAPAPEVKDIASCLVIELKQDSKLREYANLKDNPDIIQSQIWLLGKFEKIELGVCGSKEEYTPTQFRIDGFDIPGNTPTAGDGTEAAPFSASQVQSGATGTSVWVKGYIVGWIDGKSIQDGAKFSVPATVQTNLLLSDNPSATSVDECIPVQLPTSIRGVLNLMDNPSNLGKELAIKGNLTAYFGVNGVKDATEYKLDGASDAPSGPVTPVTSLNETFEGVSSISNLAGWTSKIVAGNKAWYFTSFDNNYYAACTAYKGTDDGNGYDSWLITPPLNLDGMSQKSFSFESQAAYSGGSFEVYAMTTNDPTTATLTKLNCTLATPPASGYSGFVPSGTISLAQFSGTIYIGFRYIAETSAKSMTYCIDNVIAPAGGETPEEPEEPETPDNPTTGDNVADFNTMNNGTPKSTYAEYTSANGWVATNSALLAGSASETASNPRYPFIGGENVFAPCLNGKTTTPGSLTSPTLTGGIKTLSFNYGFPYTDTQCKVTINIKQNGSVVKSQTLELTSIEKQVAYNFSMDVNVSGDFVIEIVNDCLSQATTSNKDRIAIWNLTWTK